MRFAPQLMCKVVEWLVISLEHRHPFPRAVETSSGNGVAQALFLLGSFGWGDIPVIPAQVNYTLNENIDLNFDSNAIRNAVEFFWG